MEKELIKLNATDYGIEESKAKELLGNLPNIIEERKPLEDQFSEVIKMDIESAETWITAKALRLLIQKNRTQGINIWHKAAKDFFLKGGQFVDAIKRKEVVVNERMETDLMTIEQHEKIIEEQKKQKVREARLKELDKYNAEAGIGDLADMSLEIWRHFIDSVKREYEGKIEAEKKAEEERIAKEKAEAEERKRIRIENEKLKKEAEERERLAKIEADKRAKEEKARLAKEEKERKIRDEKTRKEREAYEAKLKKEREGKEKIEREERQKREKVESELRAKIEAERKAKEAEEKRIQAELNKGDSDKVNDIIRDLETIKTKYVFKSAKNKKMQSDVNILIDKVIKHIRDGR